MASGALGATALASTAFGQSSDDGHRRLRFGNAGQLVVSSAASISVSSTSWDGSQASSSDVSVGPGADYFPVDHLSIGLGTDLDHGVSRGYTADNGVLETTPTDLSVGARFGLSLGISRRVSLWPRLTLGAHRYTETQQTIVRGSLGSATDPAVWPTVTHSGPWMEVRLPVIVSLAPGLFVGAGPRLSQDFAADDVGPYSGAQRTGVSVAIELGGYCGGGVAEAEPDDDGEETEKPLRQFGDEGVIVLTGSLHASAGTYWYSRTDADGTSIYVGPSVDWFLSKRWSVGAGILYGNTRTVGFYPSGTKFDASRESVTVPLGLARHVPLTSALSLYPRVGFGFGISNYEISSSGLSGKTSASLSTLSASLPALVHVADHFFIGVGPYVSHDLSRIIYEFGKENRATTIGATTEVGGWL